MKKESTDYRVKDTEYIKYIYEHIENVQKVWKDIQESLKEQYWLYDDAWHSINGLIKNHDKSKFSEEEFLGYRQWFYPNDDKDKNKKLFDRAWNHHQKTNPHHWEYWVMPKDDEFEILEMPFVYIFEMLCDWTAISLKFGDFPGEFYGKNLSKMMLAPGTITCIEKWIPLFDNLISSKKV